MDRSVCRKSKTPAPPKSLASNRATRSYESVHRLSRVRLTWSVHSSIAQRAKPWQSKSVVADRFSNWTWPSPMHRPAPTDRPRSRPRAVFLALATVAAAAPVSAHVTVPASAHLHASDLAGLALVVAITAAAAWLDRRVQQARQRRREDHERRQFQRH